MEVPLYGRNGEIRAVSIVDEDAYEVVSAYRWHPHSCYAATVVAGRLVLMHRLILQAPEGVEVDHISRDGLDNRRLNLRLVTHAENMQNRRSFAGSTSRYRGVHWDSEQSKWVAEVRLNGKKVFKKRFVDEESAAVAAAAARERFMTHSVER